MSEELSNGEKCKTGRVRKIYYRQLLHLLECVEDNPILLTMKFAQSFTRDLYNQEWANIFEVLNKMSDNNRKFENWQNFFFLWQLCLSFIALICLNN